jgi:hypothetical protein
VYGEVRAKSDRLLQQGGGEGVVDRDQRAIVPGRHAQGGQVSYVE